MRQMWMCSTANSLPVGSWPRNSPRCLPCIATRATTLSPSQITSSMSACIGPHSPRSQLTVSLRPSGPWGLSGGASWFTKSGWISSSAASRLPFSKSSSRTRSAIRLLSCALMPLQYPPNAGWTRSPPLQLWLGLTGQVEGHLPEAAAGLGILGLRMGRGLLGAIEEAAAHALELGGGGQPHRRLDALLEGVHRAAHLLEHDLRRHVGRRVQAREGDLGGVDALGELIGKSDLRELRLAVGVGAVVLGLEHRVAEVHRRLAERGDHHDARRGRAAKQREEAQGEEGAGEVVHREAQLVAVAALLPGRLVGTAGADARVVDQHVEAIEP